MLHRHYESKGFYEMDKRASLCPYRPFKVFRSHMLCLKWGFESDLAGWMIIDQAGKKLEWEWYFVSMTQYGMAMMLKGMTGLCRSNLKGIAEIVWYCLHILLARLCFSQSQVHHRNALLSWSVWHKLSPGTCSLPSQTTILYHQPS